MDEAAVDALLARNDPEEIARALSELRASMGPRLEYPALAWSPTLGVLVLENASDEWWYVDYEWSVHGTELPDDAVRYQIVP